MSKSVRLIECFRSFQGEGPDSGQSMYILRFKYCNLKCPWCDTSVKMRISVEAPYKIEDIQDLLIRNRSGILLTGGEPTIPKHFDDAIMILNKLDYPLANVESNGFHLEELINATTKTKNVHFMYSPKIFNDKDLELAMKKTESLLKYSNLFIKVVYENKPLITQYLGWLEKSINFEDSSRVWLMPEGITQVSLIKNSQYVFDACEKYKFNFSSRNHIMFGFV